MSKEYDEYLHNHINAVHKCYEIIYGREWFLDHSYSHDGSKYTMEEYPYYDQHFYGDPNSVSDKLKTEEEWRRAQLHHHHCNAHHWQFWAMEQDMSQIIPIEMDEPYIKELVCDWLSFSFQEKNPKGFWDWWEKNKHRILLHPASKEKIFKDIEMGIEKLEEYLANNVDD